MLESAEIIRGSPWASSWDSRERASLFALYWPWCNTPQLRHSTPHCKFVEANKAPATQTFYIWIYDPVMSDAYIPMYIYTYIYKQYTHTVLLYIIHLFDILYIYIYLLYVLVFVLPVVTYNLSFILAFISVLDSWTWECFGLSHAVHHQDGHFRIHRHPLQQSPKSLTVGLE